LYEYAKIENGETVRYYEIDENIYKENLKNLDPELLKLLAPSAPFLFTLIQLLIKEKRRANGDGSHTAFFSVTKTRDDDDNPRVRRNYYFPPSLNPESPPVEMSEDEDPIEMVAKMLAEAKNKKTEPFTRKEIREYDGLAKELLRIFSEPQNRRVVVTSGGELLEEYFPKYVRQMIPSYFIPKVTYAQNKRECYLGAILDKYANRTNKPLLLDLDKIGPKNMAIIGSTGNGKTITAYNIVEEALDRGIPAIVLDPTGQWTGFLDRCSDPSLLGRYRDFSLGSPKAYRGRIFTPSSNIGLPLETNLLAKPSTSKEHELYNQAREVAEIIDEFCGLTPAEVIEVEEKIFDSWMAGVDLNYSQIGQALKEGLGKKLGRLRGASFLFNGNRIARISDLWNNGEISVISLTEIKDEKLQMLVSYHLLREIVNHFDSLSDTDADAKKLRLLLVVEEAHRFTEAQVKKALDRISRTLRKKGVGTLFITQRFVDLDKIQTNINTKIYMRTGYVADIERAEVDIGELTKLLPTLKTGTGVFFSPDMGKPFVVEFRPCLHRNSGLAEEEIRRKMKS
jgi:DNA helicase HerA-like ATPase